MRQPSKSITFLALGLVLLSIACQAGDRLLNFNLIGAANPDAPNSRFVPARKTVRVRVGQQVVIESFHMGQGQLGQVDIFVNGQPIRTEAASAGPTFPPELAQVEVLSVDQPPQAILAGLEAPSSSCRASLAVAGPVQTNSLIPSGPVSTWTVCHVWTGLTPGTYELSVVATDRAGQKGEPIVQRIEVK